MSDETKSEVEGHGIRYGSDSEAPEDADVIGKDAGDAGEAEVEGQAIKVRYEPAAQVEGQGVRVRLEPEDKDAKPKSGQDEDDPEVEGQPLRH